MQFFLNLRRELDFLLDSARCRLLIQKGSLKISSREPSLIRVQIVIQILNRKFIDLGKLPTLGNEDASVYDFAACEIVFCDVPAFFLVGFG